MSLDDVPSLSFEDLQKYIESIDIYEYTKSSILIYYCMLRHDYLDAFQLLTNKEYLLYTVTLVQEKHHMNNEFKIIDYILENDLQDLIREIFKYGNLFNPNEMYHFAGIILQYYYFDNIFDTSDTSDTSNNLDVINKLNPGGKFEHVYYVCKFINGKQKSKHVNILNNYMKHNPSIDRIELLKELIYLRMFDLASYVMKHCCVCPVLLIEILKSSRYLIPLIECVELFDIILVAYANYLNDTAKSKTLINNIFSKVVEIYNTYDLYIYRNWNYDLVIYLIKSDAKITYNQFKIIMTNFDAIDYNLIYDNLIKNKIRFNKLSKRIVFELICKPHFDKVLIWLMYVCKFTINEISNIFYQVLNENQHIDLTNIKLMTTFKKINISLERKLFLINSFDISTILDISDYNNYLVEDNNENNKICWTFNMVGLVKREYNLNNSQK